MPGAIVVQSVDDFYSDGEYDFEWNASKASSNLFKHGVTFYEAATTFADEHSVLAEDADDPEGEPRYILTGFSSAGRLLTTIHCERGNRFRLISARLASKSEERDYD